MTNITFMPPGAHRDPELVHLDRVAGSRHEGLDQHHHGREEHRHEGSLHGIVQGEGDAPRP